ncbi:PEGA domain protein [Planctopirus ephydatiae]|uniref:PEGA domain protein n=2 Tax=Planctopirus ephydatiae TaxID=2528019 RepID=A0A518GRW2_9PLAN|nr:PEGA domain protein [Planctopirus ephydatiae]
MLFVVSRPGHTRYLWILLAGLCLLQTGCVSRRLLVQSNPPGALVLLEGEEVGYTPVAVDFTYYGTREVTLIKDGYETLKVMQPVPAPWYQWPGIDFFSDNLLPHRVTDRRRLSYSMQPKQIPPSEDLLQRADQLRNESRLGP